MSDHPPIRQSAYPPETRLRLDIEGMTCAACSSRIQRVLEQTPGVSAANVNLMTNTAAVEFDPAVASQESLIKAVEGAGYGAAVAQDPMSNGHAHHHHAAAASAPSAPVHDHGTGRAPWVPLIAFAAAMLMAMLLEGAPGGHTHDTDPLMRLMQPLTSLLQEVIPGVASVTAATWRWILLALSLFVVLRYGRHFYVRAWSAAKHGAADMNTLIALGTGAALLFSIATTVAAPWFAARGVAPAVYYEAVIGIIALIVTGQWLEERAKGRASDALNRLLALRPQAVRVIRSNGEAEIPIAEAGHWRRVPGAAGRVDRRRRRDPRGTEHHRRIDAHRRAGPGRSNRRRERGGGHRQPHRRTPGAGHPHRRRFSARADRAAGARGAGDPGTDPATGRSHLRDLCTNCRCHCHRRGGHLVLHRP